MLEDLQLLHQNIAKILRLKVPDINTKIAIAEQTNSTYPNWISFKLTDWMQSGSDESYLEDAFDEDNNFYVTETSWRVTLNIVTIGVQSEQLAITLSHNLNKSSYLDSFEELGLYLINKSGIRPAPRALASGWEQRHILDVDFNILLSDKEVIDFFDKVEITQEILNTDETLIDSITYTINLTP